MILLILLILMFHVIFLVRGVYLYFSDLYIYITKYIPCKCLSWFFLILCNLTFSPHMFQCCVFSAPTSMKCPVALLFYSIWWSPTTLQSFRQRVYKHMIPPNPSSSVKQSACPKRSSTQIFQYKIDQFSNWNNKTHHKQRNVFSNQKKIPLVIETKQRVVPPCIKLLQPPGFGDLCSLLVNFKTR